MQLDGKELDHYFESEVTQIISLSFYILEMRNTIGDIRKIIREEVGKKLKKPNSRWNPDTQPNI